MVAVCLTEFGLVFRRWEGLGFKYTSLRLVACGLFERRLPPQP